MVSHINFIEFLFSKKIKELPQQEFRAAISEFYKYKSYITINGIVDYLEAIGFAVPNDKKIYVFDYSIRDKLKTPLGWLK